MAMRWHDLLFSHWPVDAAGFLRPLIPSALQIDTHDGQGVDRCRAVSHDRSSSPLCPAPAGLSAFAEINVRTYVTGREQTGRSLVFQPRRG